jgi:hypothetical protein
MNRKPPRASSTSGWRRSPILSGTPAAAPVMILVSTMPMSSRNSPMPIAKLCLRLGEMAPASQARARSSVNTRNSTPLTNTAPRLCCHGMCIPR